ncbi:DNA-directed RNA polymerase I subunit RPA12 [Anopheles arabiensis]|uniref:DNA-directed RNA polymerase subunit n=5 Tax=gambiae species complex TaxID=44542 RepID=Q7PR45_ANOGA|nr:DNA-directed RNA polymerase I subunit RPA12 [Anopheles arabiensis]XP_040222645.1 DNA-directed RNA polymerase I subunit RPA12 [Anopheles coluzzii]XP_041763293.1 DNA-directed RNA polymerase I subunit RPA12 [Anopheles merus]XP_312581.4 DNA-directed RNA polymerase I subunit RPA12 [Anopheles gambiae]EAA07851.5 AGAP002375-PA [Anopheles gambiae str. PEST]
MDPGFCPDCGSILPPLKNSNRVSCYGCQSEFDAAAFGTMETEYTIHFNSYANKKSDQADRAEGEEAEGPIVNRQCPKCGNDQMSYATLQLRSADEGQTVFFTCTKCKYKMSENS